MKTAINYGSQLRTAATLLMLFVCLASCNRPATEVDVERAKAPPAEIRQVLVEFASRPKARRAMIRMRKDGRMQEITRSELRDSVALLREGDVFLLSLNQRATSAEDIEFINSIEEIANANDVYICFYLQNGSDARVDDMVAVGQWISYPEGYRHPHPKFHYYWEGKYYGEDETGLATVVARIVKDKPRYLAILRSYVGPTRPSEAEERGLSTPVEFCTDDDDLRYPRVKGDEAVRVMLRTCLESEEELNSGYLFDLPYETPDK